jgi:hypothetical protein
MAGADRSMTQPRPHAAKERDRHFGRSPTHLRAVRSYNRAAVTLEDSWGPLPAARPFRFGLTSSTLRVPRRTDCDAVSVGIHNRTLRTLQLDRLNAGDEASHDQRSADARLSWSAAAAVARDGSGLPR